MKCLELKAYDYMLRFEKDFNGFESVGTAFDFVNLCCKACDVEMAQSEAWYLAQANGNTPLSIYSDNDIETYRDVLYYVGQVLGGFFCINRAGKLELRKFGNEPVMTVLQKHRFSSSFSDFITRYTAVSSTNMRTEIAEYYHLDVDDGLTMNLGVNPLLQFGLDETRKQLCTNILNDLAVVDYVPFDSDTIGNPALDLGDVLRFSGGQADSERISAITSMQCKIGGKQTLKGVGKNPRLSQAKSKNDKNISGLLNQIEAGKIGIHTFTNASAFTVTDVDTKIISIEFATSEDNHAQFFGQVVVDVAADAVEKSAVASGTVEISDASVDVELPVSWSEDGEAEVVFTFEFNDEEILAHHPAETWHTGKHTILLYYPIEDVVANYTNTFNVYMRVSGGSGTVDTGNCVASVTGQSMGASAAWDGTIEVEESVSRWRFGTGNEAGRIRAIGMKEATGWEIDELMKRSYEDTVSGKTAIGAFGVMFDVG